MADFLDEDETEELREMVKELLDVDEGLSSKEIDFLESLNNWEGNFTVRQGEWIERIYKRIFK
jgi:hypothetical protein